VLEKKLLLLKRKSQDTNLIALNESREEHNI